MAYTGFIKGPSGHNLTTSWFMFSNAFLDADQLLVFANRDDDHCQLDRIEYDKDGTVFKVHIKDILRDYISENTPFKFHLIYTTKSGKIYKQTIEYEKEASVWPPQELKLTTLNIGRI